MALGENNYAEFYERERIKIEKKLSKLFINKKPKSLYNPCAYGIGSGGKRLRPLLVLLSAKAVGGNFSDVYNAALAVEVFHNFTLVHDDIMDNADTRRNLPSLHKKYDVNTAILTGDNLLGISYELLLKDCNGSTKEVVNLFTHAMIEVCEGQGLDKEFETKENVSLKEYKEMIGKKTAALSEVCCAIGATLAGGNAEEIKALRNYGKNLGMAFQIQDDLLDIFADNKKFGKKVGGDLMEGKKTFLFLKALEKAEGENRKPLLNFIKNKGIKRNEIKKYQSLYNKLGVFDVTLKEVKQYTNRALRSLNSIGNEENIKPLIWLANMLIKRSY